MSVHAGREIEGPVVYSLERGGPSVPRLDAFDLVIILFLAVLAVGAVLLW